MKFIISILLIALLSFAACLYLPWWSIAIVAFIVTALIPQSAGMSFLTGFLALFLLWGMLSFWMSSSNEHILAHKVSLIFLKIDNAYLLMLATAFIGGIVAGFAAMTASFLRQKKHRSPY
ncbi:MAG TPA: hypothetical protein VMY77_17665 [Chitinophagaceae bacterium]|nr:hypothetical protein [Chitinophagaceae bacterium]